MFSLIQIGGYMVEESVRKRPGRLLKIIIIILCVLAFLLAGTVIAFSVSPVAGSMLIRAMFDKPPAPPPSGMEYENEVIASKDISYGGSRDELFDLYLPAEGAGPLPLIIWVHGGAFVGGDKADVEFLARAIAVNGYAVASINYSRAPEAGYPTPVLQTGKAYDFLTSGTYPGSERVDTRRIFLAGDSAGAHITAQLAILQTNLPQREAFLSTHKAPDFTAPISGDVLKGVLLYCGPYSIPKLLDAEHPLLKFLVSQTGWAYFKDRNPAQSPFANEADIIQHVTADFPPAFITDGNTLSFPEHAKELAERLSALGVSISELYFDDSPEDVPHEYQFDLRGEAGQTALEYALEFLRRLS